MAKKHHYLVPEERAAELQELGRELIQVIRAAEKQYGVRLHCSYDANFIEVLDKRSTLPEGYEFAAVFSLNDSKPASFDVSELIPEDRPKAPRRTTLKIVGPTKGAGA